MISNCELNILPKFLLFRTVTFLITNSVSNSYFSDFVLMQFLVLLNGNIIPQV